MPGDGSVFRRASDGQWVAQLSIGSRTDRRYLTKTIGPRKPTRAEERAAIDKLRAKAGGASNDTLTTGAYLERWVNEARDLRHATRYGYRVVVTHHLGPTIGSVPLRDLTPVDVEAALARLGDRMSAKSLRNVHAVLRRALGQARRSGLIDTNPASREYIDAPRVPAYEPDALSETEVRRVLKAADGDRLEGLFTLAVATGLRQGELLGLEWQDIRADHVRVRQELVYRDGKYHRDPPKTDRSKRAVPFPPSVSDAMQRHRRRVIADGFVPIDTGPVFVNTSGKPLSGSWVTHRFYRLLESAGVRKVPFKILRATYGSRLADAGVPEVEIAALMGHARTHTTKRHYIARGTAQTVRAVDVIAGMLESVTESVTAGSTMHAGGRR